LAQITAQAWQRSTRSAPGWQARRCTGLLTAKGIGPALRRGHVVDLIGGPIGFRKEEMKLANDRPARNPGDQFVFDRSSPAPMLATLLKSSGTSEKAMYVTIIAPT
jgi:hypothetical protein